jgi:hypothetical protein
VSDVVDAEGGVAAVKLEGLEERPSTPSTFDVVADLDRPGEPAKLGRLSVEES